MRQKLELTKEGLKKKDLALLEDAIENGATTYPKLMKLTGLTRSRLKRLMDSEPKLWAAFKQSRKHIADKAVDNIQAILDDPSHPQHFSASKYILQKYKTELDDVLEGSEDGGLLGKLGGKIPQVNITFGESKEED